MICLVNAVFGIFIFNYNIDLTNYRGLNNVLDQDGSVTRTFFESACLMIVVRYDFIKNIILRALCYVTVLYFLIFIAKSLFIIGLFLTNYWLRYVKLKDFKLLKVCLSVLIFMVIIGVAGLPPI
jgi:hypothetical protein